mmetsp:Transcript_50187/g.145855  ORF Transcript_50187/g.145855 Transcript_50187/m.145855 type:complete len:238 (+) Transcript_50187:219-932(+)
MPPELVDWNTQAARSPCERGDSRSNSAVLAPATIAMHSETSFKARLDRRGRSPKLRLPRELRRLSARDSAREPGRSPARVLQRVAGDEPRESDCAVTERRGPPTFSEASDISPSELRLGLRVAAKADAPAGEAGLPGMATITCRGAFLLNDAAVEDRASPSSGPSADASSDGARTGPRFRSASSTARGHSGASPESALESGGRCTGEHVNFAEACSDGASRSEPLHGRESWPRQNFI